MRTRVVKKKLRRDEAALVVCLHYTDASIHEMTSLMGFDCIWLDLDHHGYSVETATQMMRAARVGRADIHARPAKGEFTRMARLLEMGATGILDPRSDNAEEAAKVVRWAKFAPQGRRGVDGANPDMPYLMMPIGEYIRRANEETFIAIQLEDADAVSRADQIASVEGVDILFFGPGDFSILGGFPGQTDHPELQQALEHGAATAHRHGKHWGMPCYIPEQGRKLLDMVARFLEHGADIVLLKRALENIQA